MEEVAYVPIDDLAEIEGFDESVGTELQSRANDWIVQQRAEAQGRLTKLGVKDDLSGFEGLNETMLLALAEKGVLSLDDFADLSRDEFQEILPQSGMSNDDIDAMIMRARAHWFADEDAAGKQETA